ncbi:MAG: rRNA maturation RNase YbeY [Planctomycetota bacterium]
MRVDIANRDPTFRAPRALIMAAVHAASRVGRLRARSLSVVIVGAAEMRRLNRQFLGHDYVTDVLSFPFGDQDPVGELVVCAAFAAGQARARGHSPREELLLYVVHGTLHLAGFMDQQAADVKRMRAAERRALARIGIVRDLWVEQR